MDISDTSPVDAPLIDRFYEMELNLPSRRLPSANISREAITHRNNSTHENSACIGTDLSLLDRSRAR